MPWFIYGILLQDISLLRGLGIKFVIIPGTHVLIDRLLVERGEQTFYNHLYILSNVSFLFYFSSLQLKLSVDHSFSR